MKLHRAAIALSVVLLGLFGCVEPPMPPAPLPQFQKFNRADFELYGKTGTGSVVGSAFLKTRGGDVKVGAGCEVELIALTPYMEERYERILVRGENLERRDFRVADYTRKTVADAQGRFEFTGVPAGKYSVTCDIRWEYFNGHYRDETGGTAYARVVVRDGTVSSVVVTR